MFTSRKESVDRVLKYVAPVIEERRRNMELYGQEWADKPVCMATSRDSDNILIMTLQNDLLQWLLDSPAGQAESVPDMAQRLLVLNFASIHTSSMVRAFLIASIRYLLRFHAIDAHRLSPPSYTASPQTPSIFTHYVRKPRL